jgi:hypothetical protein
MIAEELDPLGQLTVVHRSCTRLLHILRRPLSRNINVTDDKEEV